MPESKIAGWTLGTSLVLILVIGTSFGYEAYSKHQALEKEVAQLTSGDPERGRDLAQCRGCVGCHDIPGTRGPRGNVGPPLAGIATRVYVGGVLLNTPDNLRRWLLDPPRIDPRSAMPNVGLTDQEARDLSAFLYTLR
jgi:cytochrome c